MFICSLLIAGLAGAQSSGQVWEGTASMSRYGEFPATGLYGASNSFPRNTIVEVENLQNGEKTTVIITDRLSNPGLFLLLSREASGALGITQDETVQVRVALENDSDRMADSLVGESPYSSDPDVNPAALAEAYELPEVTEEPEIVEEPEIIEEPEVMEDETPRMVLAVPTPEMAQPRIPSLVLPEEPTEVAIVEEEPEEVPVLDDTPRLTAMDESPAYETFRLPDLAVPEGPPAAAEEGVLPETEAPEITALGTSPAIPGLKLTVIPAPAEPSEKEPVEETPVEIAEPSEQGPLLTYMTNPSPDVDPLELWDLDVPSVPSEAVVEEEDETPAVLTTSGSPFVDELQIAALDEPMEIVETVEEPVEPEDTTPELALLETGTPERVPDVSLETIDEPTEPSEEVAEETSKVEEPEEVSPVEDDTPLITEMIDGELEVEIPEDTMLVLEPAEPRPPEDVTPKAVEVPGTDLEESETEEPAGEPKDYPEPPAEETAKEPLIVKEIPEKETSAMEEPVEITGDTLQKGAYYVQLGVYSEKLNAKQVADTYRSSYPVAVLQETSAAKQIYKVLLGPVNYDESGGLLFNFRAKGFKDAFIRRE